MRHHRLIPALFLALGFAAPAWAQRLPQYVAGPFSGFVYDCQQAGQAAPSARSMVLTADLDGDRAPDHVIDAGRGCAANKLLFCGPDGCKVDVYLSTESGLGGSYRARRVRLLKNKLELITDGPACGKPAGADCVEIHGWNGSELVRESIE
jgi:hypothetical protein